MQEGVAEHEHAFVFPEHDVVTELVVLAHRSIFDNLALLKVDLVTPAATEDNDDVWVRVKAETANVFELRLVQLGVTCQSNYLPFFALLQEQSLNSVLPFVLHDFESFAPRGHFSEAV